MFLGSCQILLRAEPAILVSFVGSLRRVGLARQQLRKPGGVKSGGCGQELQLSWVVALFLSFDYGVLGCGCYGGLGSAALLTLHSEASKFMSFWPLQSSAMFMAMDVC